MHPISLILLVFGLFSTPAFAQSNLVGTVSSEGEPVPFASVLIKNSRLGTAADVEGYFIIENIPAGTYKVVASSLGFLSEQKEVKGWTL